MSTPPPSRSPCTASRCCRPRRTSQRSSRSCRGWVCSACNSPGPAAGSQALSWAVEAAPAVAALLSSARLIPPVVPVGTSLVATASRRMVDQPLGRGTENRQGSSTVVAAADMMAALRRGTACQPLGRGTENRQGSSTVVAAADMMAALRRGTACHPDSSTLAAALVAGARCISRLSSCSVSLGRCCWRGTWRTAPGI
jgi:hypothetical protein